MVNHSLLYFGRRSCTNGSVILNYYDDTGNTVCTDLKYKDAKTATKNDYDFSNLLSMRLTESMCLRFLLYTSKQICVSTFHTPILWDSKRVTQFNQYKTDCDKDNLLTTLCDYGSSECFTLDRICSFERDIYGDPVHCTDTGHLRFCKTHQCPDAFKCHQSYCIAVHMVCDDVPDCPDGEDEHGCNSLQTTGMFRYNQICARNKIEY